MFQGDVPHTIKNLIKSKSKKTSPHSPWQNAYCERVIGTLRRECLNHMFIITHQQLRRVLREYVNYYNNFRPHSSLANDSPLGREKFQKDSGEITSTSVLGGLHHIYKRAA
jgi:hypothetical protein